MKDSSVEQLALLREELTSDVMLCTTRDQHIRMIQYIARLDLVLELAKSIQADGQSLIN